MEIQVKPTLKEISDNDTMLIWAVKFNDKNPIKWQGGWLPIGTLRELMKSATPTPPQEVKGKK